MDNLCCSEEEEEDEEVAEEEEEEESSTFGYVNANTRIYFILTNFQGLMKGQTPTFLLMIDTAQVCGIAGDTACVATQNQFKTFNLVTKLDATGRTWLISGQVQNVAKPAGKTLVICR